MFETIKKIKTLFLKIGSGSEIFERDGHLYLKDGRAGEKSLTSLVSPSHQPLPTSKTYYKEWSEGSHITIPVPMDFKQWSKHAIQFLSVASGKLTITTPSSTEKVDISYLAGAVTIFKKDLKPLKFESGKHFSITIDKGGSGVYSGVYTLWMNYNG